jgi:translation initiation factor 1A
MVKNTAGGNKAKGQARKFVTVKPKNILRAASSDLELYAKIQNILGNGMCYVLCSDNVVRLCHIRGKFRGRGKKDNFVKNNSFILVGLREWEVDNTNNTKMQNCDLLEVYSDAEKEKLKNEDRSINWSIFLANENNTVKSQMEADIEFTDSKTDEYNSIIEAQLSQKVVTTIHMADDEEINIDDI